MVEQESSRHEVYYFMLDQSSFSYLSNVIAISDVHDQALVEKSGWASSGRKVSQQRPG